MQALPAKGLQVLAGILHAHLLGRAVTLRHIRDGKELPPILAGDNAFLSEVNFYKKSI
jgi:hypothetical protein